MSLDGEGHRGRDVAGVENPLADLRVIYAEGGGLSLHAEGVSEPDNLLGLFGEERTQQRLAEVVEQARRVGFVRVEHSRSLRQKPRRRRAAARMVAQRLRLVADPLA